MRSLCRRPQLKLCRGGCGRLITLGQSRQSITRMIKAGVPAQEAIDRGPLCCHCTNLLRRDGSKSRAVTQLKEESDATSR
jgi:hypothetical protein